MRRSGAVSRRVKRQRHKFGEGELRTFNVQHSTFNIQHRRDEGEDGLRRIVGQVSEVNGQETEAQVRRGRTSNVQHSTFNIEKKRGKTAFGELWVRCQRSMVKRQRQKFGEGELRTFNVQHSTFNIEGKRGKGDSHHTTLRREE